MIQLKDIGFGYGGQTLMEGLRLHIRPRDRIGLVGPNGVGKTTLLRIISGDIEHFDGSIDRRKRLKVGLLPQEAPRESGRTVYKAALEPFAELRKMEEEIETLNARAAEASGGEQDRLLARAGDVQQAWEAAGGFDYKARAASTLTGLGFPREDFDRDLGELSGGWQMRVALAKLLLSDPDVALLDEPTNHLDLPAIVWFENYLATFEGAMVVISHDRYFLDRTIHRIAHFNQRRLDIYEGNYSKYEEEKERRREALLNAKARQDKEIARVERFVERFRYKATKARQVQSRIKALDKVDRIEIEGEESTIGFSFRTQARSGQKVLELAGVSKSYGEKRVLCNVNLVIERGERVAVIGANGLGKSTLMRVMAGRTDFEGERTLGHNATVDYFSQDQYELLDPTRTVLEEAERACGEGFQGNVRTLLGAFLLTGDDAMKRVESLSGGEKSRLLLARMMADPANFLLLDEPTNHLDPASRRTLENALLDYDGTICFVTHDRNFINRLATRILEITPDGIETYIGNYDEYVDQKKLREEIAAAKEGASAEKNPAEKPAQAEGRRESRQKRAQFIQERSRVLSPLRDAVARAEAEIEASETRIAELEEALSDPDVYKDPEKAKSLPQELKAQKDSLERAMGEWEAASEALAEKERDFEE